MAEKTKVLVAKLGLDIHWRGAVMVSRYLRDAGMEVVYLGNSFPEEIVEAALQEGAHVVGLSTLCGNHLTLGPKVVELLRQKGVKDVAVYIGGTIPPEDHEPLRKAGLDEVFPPETPLDKIVACINSHVSRVSA